MIPIQPNYHEDPVMQIKKTEAWKTLTMEDLRTCLYPPQLAILFESDEPVVVQNLVEAVIQDCISRVRAEIHGTIRNPLDDDPATVPPEVRGATIILILQALQCRIPGMILTDDQRDRVKDARYLLQRIGRGDLPITMPILTPPFWQRKEEDGTAPFVFLGTKEKRSGRNLSRKTLQNL